MFVCVLESKCTGCVYVCVCVWGGGGGQCVCGHDQSLQPASIIMIASS